MAVTPRQRPINALLMSIGWFIVVVNRCGDAVKTNLGMSRNFQVGEQRLAGLLQREVFQIRFRGLAEIADAFGHGIALSRGACFGIVDHETALRG